MTQAPLANRFAEYAGRLRFDDLPGAVVHEARRRFIDSIATAVGAMPAEAYAAARRCTYASRASRGPASSAAVAAASNGRPSSTACSFAISIITTPIYRWNRPIRATTWPRCWPSAIWSAPAART